jgi:diaminopimelate decarboxylase
MDALVFNTEPSLPALLAARPALSMADGTLHFEGVSLAALAAQYGTPLWVYGADTLTTRYAALHAALPAVHIHYAVKANDHLAILTALGRAGAGADVVSEGELRRALRAGIPARNIVFSGVGKTIPALQAAITAGVGQINVESPAELTTISALATAAGIRQAIALRMNPDVDAGTHEKITTGRADNKFGIAYTDIPALYAHAASLPGLEPVGIALHIGSQILDTAPYDAAYARAATQIRALRAAGQRVRILDLGGGLGIGYGADPGISLPAFAATVARATHGLDVTLMLEPGRYLAAPAGLLLTSVILEKTGGSKRFTVVDAAMNDLIRPAMYEAWHGILPVAAANTQTTPTDIVGPVCETADCFASNRALPDLAPGALLAILDAGAYGAVMSSSYNARARAAAVLLRNGQAHLITTRGTIEELWAAESTPA